MLARRRHCAATPGSRPHLPSSGGLLASCRTARESNLDAEQRDLLAVSLPRGGSVARCAHRRPAGLDGGQAAQQGRDRAECRRRAGRSGRVRPGGVRGRWGGSVARCAHRRRAGPDGGQAAQQGRDRAARRRRAGRGGRVRPGGGREGFEVDGEVRLLGAHIAGVLDLTGAKLRNKDGIALRADRIQVEGGVFGREGFEVDGEVRLLDAHIAGQLALTGAKLRNPDGIALNAGRLHVDDSLIWRPATVLGGIDFRFARVGIWADTEAAMSFPAALEGLQYDAIHQASVSLAVSARLDWLALDPYGYSPSSYVQLASVLRAGGHERQARQVLIASQQGRRTHGRNWLTRTSSQSLSAVLRWTVGYDYRPWLALIWLLALIGTASSMIEILPGGAAKSFTPMTGAPAPFHALLYVLHSVFPFVDFGYSLWVPNGAAQWITVISVVLGWALATAVVSAFAGILHRGD